MHRSLHLQLCGNTIRSSERNLWHPSHCLACGELWEIFQKEVLDRGSADGTPSPGGLASGSFGPLCGSVSNHLNRHRKRPLGVREGRRNGMGLGGAQATRWWCGWRTRRADAALWRRCLTTRECTPRHSPCRPPLACSPTPSSSTTRRSRPPLPPCRYVAHSL